MVAAVAIRCVAHLYNMGEFADLEGRLFSSK